MGQSPATNQGGRYYEAMDHLSEKRWTIFLTISGFLLFALLPSSWAAGDAGKGKATYEKLCISCHGMSGKGDGPAAAKLAVKPRDHTDANVMSHLTEQNIFDVIKGGGAAVEKSPLMPPYGAALKDDQIWDMAAYVRTLSKK